MSTVLALVASARVVAAFTGLAVAVAAVVVVLAIVAVIVMVLRNNGSARRAAGGLGYDAQGSLGQPRGEFDAGAPWGRQAGPTGQPGQPGQPGQLGSWQGGGQDYGAPGQAAGGQGRSGPLGWGQGASEAQPAGGAWGQQQPAPPPWGEAPAAQPSGGAWGEPDRGWNSGGGTAPAMGGAQRGQSQSPWDIPGGPTGGANVEPPSWAQPWGPSQNPAAPASAPWGQPESPAVPAAPAAGAWGTPAQPAAGQQAGGQWGTPPGGSGGLGGQPWGQPAGPAPAPAEPQGWGTPASPSGPNWGAQQGAPAAAVGGGWGQGQDAGWGAQQNAPAAAGMGQPFGVAQAPTGVSQRAGVIIVRQGKEPGRVYEVRGDRLTIGRSRDSDIFLEDLAVSRLHATVYRDDQGRYLVRDENSANGTTVNGQRIGEHVLDEGDEIGLGQTVLAFARR